MQTMTARWLDATVQVRAAGSQAAKQQQPHLLQHMIVQHCNLLVARNERLLSPCGATSF
jgi:hypothetical protein